MSRKAMFGFLSLGTILGIGMLWSTRPADAGPARNGCKLVGSWLGSAEVPGFRGMVTYHGDGNEGTDDIDWAEFDATLFGTFPTATTVSSSRGVWVRSGPNTFGYTLVTFVKDASGSTVYLLKTAGTKSLTEDCNCMEATSIAEFYAPDQDPFGDEAPDFGCADLGLFFAKRMHIDPPPPCEP